MGNIVSTREGPASIQSVPSVEHEMLLIRRIVGGRPDLFGDLMEPHLPGLRWMVKAKMEHDPDFEDVVQQAVYMALTNLDCFRFEARFRTWLIRIALNEVSQHRRRRRELQGVDLDRLPFDRIQTNPEESPFHVCARHQSIRLLEAALSRLPEKYRVVVRMCDLEGRSAAEVAKIMSLSSAAVKSRRYRGRVQLLRVLSPTRSEPPHFSRVLEKGDRLVYPRSAA